MKFQSFVSAALFSAFMLTIATSCTYEGKKEVGDSATELGKDLKNEAERVGDKAADAADKAAADMTAEKNDLAARINKSMDRLSEEIDAADKKMEKATAAEKAKWKVRRAELVQRKDALNADLSEMKSDAKVEWTSFKAKVNKAIDDVEKDFKSE